jgi:uncharacterized protein
MSKEYLPTKVDPFRFADQAIRLEGVLLIKDLHRLHDSLLSTEGEVNVRVQFGVDEQKIHYMRGHYTTQLVLQCKRCMEQYVQNVTGEVRSGFVQTEEEADQLPDYYDPVVVSAGVLAIADVIEDELIIGLPIVPMHAAKDCKVSLPLILSSDDVSNDVTLANDEDHPFKVIELLRKKHNSKE